MNGHSSDGLGDQIIGLSRQIRRMLSVALASQKVTPAQSRTLRLVAEFPGIRPSEIAERLRIAPRSTTDVLDSLESRGLITRVRDAEDRRAVLVSTTPAGDEAYASINQTRRGVLDGITESLSDDEQEVLRRLLGRLQDNLDLGTPPKPSDSSS